MNSDIVKVRAGHASIEIPHSVVVQNFLASLRTDQPETAGAKLPRIGYMWDEQGGIYAGVMRGDSQDTLYHLIICPPFEAKTVSAEWGNAGKDTAATSSWDGLANTLALTGATDGEDHPAAQHCASLTVNGFSDWYLPARREASLCAATCPEAFSEGWHWTSTQFSAYLAYVQVFSDGYQYYDGRDYRGRVRAVRRFIIN